MPEYQCMYIMVHDLSLVIRACHECLSMFLRGEIESLVIDTFKAVFNDYISFLLCFKYTLVQIGVLHNYSLIIDYHISWNSLSRTVYYVFLIQQTLYLWSESCELRDAMPIVFILQKRSRQLRVNVEEWWKQRELVLVHFLIFIVHELPLEVVRVIQF